MTLDAASIGYSGRHSSPAFWSRPLTCRSQLQVLARGIVFIDLAVAQVAV